MPDSNMSFPGIIDYVAVHGSKTLEEVPLSAVDGLVFSAMSYIHFDGLIPDSPQEAPAVKETAAAILALPERKRLLRVRSLENQRLLEEMAKSRRFSGLRLTAYRDIKSPDLEMQFSAITLLLGSGDIFVVFRGTDGTLIGWKEDFNLGFQDTVPGQWTACYYLSNMASLAAGSVWVGGHSKGGNLAVFSAACTFPDITPRIRAVFNYDGPGFSQAVLDTPGYRTALPLVRTFLPQSSVVGMFLGHEESYTIVQSGLKGLMQHDPYSWEIRDGDFIRLKEITEGSCLVDRTIKTWISELSPEERRAFVDTVFDILRSSGATRTGELLLPDNVMEIIGSFLKETSVKRDNILLPLTSLLKAAGKTLTSFYLDAS